MSSGRSVIEVDGVSKLYRRLRPGFQLRTLKSALLDGSLVRDIRPEDAIAAIQEVSFSVAAGEAFGVIGSNGSGKSTLLKLVAGILKPSAGQITVDGRLAALIELGAGFHPEISGRENIFINGAILGMTKRQIERRFDSIVEFSGLADFLDEPVKKYSSGMYVRLGFAVAVHTEPDVLLVDEVLAVGDEAFAHRCLRRIEEMLAQGRTLLFVSHTLSLVEEICDRVLWIDKGRPRLLGDPRRVVDAYRQAVAEEEGRVHQLEKERREGEPSAAESDRGPGPESEADPSDEPGRSAAEPEGVAATAPPVDADAELSDAEEAEEEAEEPEEVLRWGSKEAEIRRVRLLVGDGAGDERYHMRSGEPLTVEIQVVSHRELEDFVFGVALSTPRGHEVWGTNTDLEGFVPVRLDGEVVVRVRCPELRLAPGEYLLDVAVHARSGYSYDYRRKLVSFTVTAPKAGVGVYFPLHEWEFAGPVHWDDESRPGR